MFCVPRAVHAEWRKPGTQPGCFLPLSAYRKEERGRGRALAAGLRADKERDINKLMEGGE